MTAVGSTENTRDAVAVVDVLALGEGGDQARVLGEVGDAAQLDLVVVGDQQLAARPRHERPAEQPALLGADRDVVEVRLVATTAGPCGPPSG